MPTHQQSNNGQWAKWLGVGVAALLVALLFRGCDKWGQTTQVPAPEPVTINKVAESATKTMLLTGVNLNGKFTLNGMVPSDAVKTQIDAELKKTFGDGNYINNLTVAADVKPANWLSKLSDLFGFFKLPGSEVTFNGDAITLSGTAGALRDKLQAFVGQGSQVMSLNIAAAAQVATGSALDALNGLNADATGETVLQAMGLQIINFASGSAEIPVDNQAVLRKAAQLLKAQPAFKFEIGGHADNVGKSDANLALSDKRAQAVRAFLLKNGVASTNINAQGYGDAVPVADNTTETGRLKNRRIEYKAQ